MSQVLYVVRLREVFRLREIYDVRVDRLPPQALFSSLKLAENFISTKIPIEHNPFRRNSEWCINEEEGWIYLIGSWDYHLHLPYEIHLSSLIMLVTECQLPLPDVPSGAKNWEFWWDENAPTMTDDQKAALWRLLDPQPWEIVEVELEDGR